MRYLIFLVVLTTMFSCGQNDTKQKELELKDRELALKEKELNLSEKDSAKTTATIDTGKNNFKQEATSTLLVLTPLNIDGNIGYVTFSQNNKTVFYFDAASKKGKIKLNGVEYILIKMEGSYKLTGSNVNITTTKGKWEEMESDCSYGKSLDVTIKMGTQVLKLSNVEVQDCSSMVE
jgi:hypothetical protein